VNHILRVKQVHLYIGARWAEPPLGYAACDYGQLEDAACDYWRKLRLSKSATRLLKDRMGCQEI